MRVYGQAHYNLAIIQELHETIVGQFTSRHPETIISIEYIGFYSKVQYTLAYVKLRYNTFLLLKAGEKVHPSRKK
jgi:hypothetical protein